MVSLTAWVYALKKLYRKRFLIVISLLFFLSLTAPITVTQVTAAPPTQTEIGEVTSPTDRAKQLFQAGRFADAASAWQQEAATFAAQGDTLNQAMALSNLSLSYQQLGQWEPAQQAIRESLTLLHSQKNTPQQQRILTQTLDIQGQLQYNTGQLEAALDSWQQAANRYQQLGDRNGVIQSQINQAQTLQDLGLYPRACTLILETLNLNRQGCGISDEELQTLLTQPPSSLKVTALRSLGNIVRVIGNSQQSYASLQASLQLAQKLDDPQAIAASYLSLGNTVRALANQDSRQSSQRSQYLREALEYYQQAAKLTPSPAIRVQAQLNQLNLLLANEQLTEAQSLLPTLEAHLNSLPSSRTKVYAQINYARNLMKLPQIRGERTTPTKQQTPDNGQLTDKIDRILAAAAQQANRLGDKRAQAYALKERGQLYEFNQQWELAQDYTLEALNLAPAYQAEDIAYQLFWQLGRIRNARGDNQDAIAAYTKAYTTLQSLRGDLVAVSSDIQFSFRESVEPVYRELVELLLQPQDGSEPTQENLAQARQVIESLQLAELDNFFREACTTVNPVQIDEVDENSAVIYSIILKEQLEVILAIPKQPLRHYSTPLPQTEVIAGLSGGSWGNLVSRMRGAVERSRPLVGVEPVNEIAEVSLQEKQQFYDGLIRPAEADLANNNIQTLVFVLDGVLRNIPVAALYDGEQYLIEKYSIALTPGLQLLDPKPLTREELEALAAGLSEARRDWSALPNVEAELQQIQQEVTAKVLINESFTTPNFRTTIDTFAAPVVHIATHGQFSSSADDTYIVTWDGQVNANELDDLLRSEARERRPIELLVLSACETATGDERAALGLAGIAVRAGARTTVASLWKVSDEATALLMSRFYEEYANNQVTKAEALRRAQLSILQDENFNNPYYWAAFVLVGNWL